MRRLLRSLRKGWWGLRPRRVAAGCKKPEGLRSKEEVEYLHMRVGDGSHGGGA